jgi:hypothetical protein
MARSSFSASRCARTSGGVLPRALRGGWVRWAAGSGAWPHQPWRSGRRGAIGRRRRRRGAGVGAQQPGPPAPRRRAPAVVWAAPALPVVPFVRPLPIAADPVPLPLRSPVLLRTPSRAPLARALPARRPVTAAVHLPLQVVVLVHGLGCWGSAADGLPANVAGLATAQRRGGERGTIAYDVLIPRLCDRAALRGDTQTPQVIFSARRPGEHQSGHTTAARSPPPWQGRPRSNSCGAVFSQPALAGLRRGTHWVPPSRRRQEAGAAFQPSAALPTCSK